MRGLCVILFVVLLVAASGCVQTVPRADVQTTPSTPSPVATIPTTALITTEKTTFPTITVPNLKSPYITINDVGTHFVGDSFYINGWSDLPNGSRLHVDIMQQLGRHPQHGDVIVGFTGDTVLNGSDNHRKFWELMVETPDFVPAMYDVTITCVENPNVEERVYFNMTAQPVPGGSVMNPTQ
jgi:hypothetical protein